VTWAEDAVYEITSSTAKTIIWYVMEMSFAKSLGKYSSTCLSMVAFLTHLRYTCYRLEKVTRAFSTMIAEDDGWPDPQACLEPLRGSECMRAVVYDRYGPPDVLRLAEVERPVPKEDEVLVKIQATTVTRADCATREANRRSGPAVMLLSRLISGLRRPRQRILGNQLAGEVEAVGAAVNEFALGDHIFGSSGFRFGAHAEFICVRRSALIAHMPAGMSFEEAAAVCDGGLNALWCLRLADLSKGQRILIYGASGAIGTAGVQLAKYFEADVTAVCSTKNLELVRSLGADRMIDYTQEDFTKNGQTYDVIFDAVGKHSFKRCRDTLSRGGSYLATDGLQNLILAQWTKLFGDKRVLFSIPPRYTKQDVLFLKQLIESGKYRAVIDRCYRLEDVVEATRYVETEQKTGNVVLVVSGDHET
jgi:NADPH:quinone reductase-like Zn-dependent oxidoreductase